MQHLHCRHAIGQLQRGKEQTYLSVVTRTNATKSTEMNLIQNLREWRRYRQTVKELSRLSARELKDIGITRGEIPAVAARHC